MENIHLNIKKVTAKNNIAKINIAGESNIAIVS